MIQKRRSQKSEFSGKKENMKGSTRLEWKVAQALH
jgi:hypothetical protein